MHKIGIIGFGKMGAAMANRLKGSYALCAFDKVKEKTSGISGLEVAADATEAARGNDALILAVKPQELDGLLETLRQEAVALDKLFISIAAGVTTAHIEGVLGRVRVIRAMPNLPAQIGEGMTVLSPGAFIRETDLPFAECLFAQMGKTEVIEEKLMNAVTAVSGSGPAYVCYFLQQNGFAATAVPADKRDEFLAEFIRGARELGLNAEQARRLVIETYAGTIKFLEETKLPAQQLSAEVSSKGGTTEAALAVLFSGGTITEALKAACRRAGELSRS